jgi:hypothetical protein
MSGTQFCFKGLGISLISGMDMESAWNEWMETVVSFSHLLSTVNSSINFVIYCYKDDKFREILLKMIRCGARFFWVCTTYQNGENILPK